jgi:hypothetical protein
LVFLIRDFDFVLCCGGDLATMSTARSKRCHASGSSSLSLDVRDFAMVKNPDYAHLFAPFLSASLPTIKEDDPYFAALGRFIVRYAAAEHQVHGLAIRLAGITEAKGRIIFSGMRLGDLAERVRGLLRATKASERLYSEVDACVTQIDIIGTQRNKLVHRFSMYHSGAIFVTNLPTAKSEAAIEGQSFTLADLTQMTTDCLCITLRLLYVKAKKPTTKEDRETLRWSRGPWRYKPPPPAQKAKQRPSVPQSRKPQPPASGG